MLAQRALGEPALAKEDGRYHCREDWTEWLQVRSLGANVFLWIWKKVSPDPDVHLRGLPPGSPFVHHITLHATP